MLFNCNLVISSFSFMLWFGLYIDFVTYMCWYSIVSCEFYSRIIEAVLEKSVVEEDFEHREAGSPFSSQSGLPWTDMRTTSEDFKVFHFWVWFTVTLQMEKDLTDFEKKLHLVIELKKMDGSWDYMLHLGILNSNTDPEDTPYSLCIFTWPASYFKTGLTWVTLDGAVPTLLAYTRGTEWQLTCTGTWHDFCTTGSQSK